jgi:hypothetical protein
MRGTMVFKFLILVVTGWAPLTVLVLQHWSGVVLSPAASRGFGFSHVAIGAVGTGLTQIASANEPVYASLSSNLMVGFSSAATGIHVARCSFRRLPDFSGQSNLTQLERT